MPPVPYYNRAVYLSLRLLGKIYRHSLKTNKQHKQILMFARICIEKVWFVKLLFVSYGVICLPLSLLSRSSVRVKSRTHDPVQVLDEAKDSITSIHLSKHEILIGYVYNNSLIVSFSTCSC